MRRLTILLAMLTLPGPGCALVRDGTSLTIFKIRESVEDIRETSRNRKWAESAWESYRTAGPAEGYSEDFAVGFKDGFAYYVYRGGNGEPPPMPPRHYRRAGYQTPQGYRAIEDWFAGFRQGAGAARDSGYRRWITGPWPFQVPVRPTVAAAQAPASDTSPVPAQQAPVIVDTMPIQIEGEQTP